MWELRIVPFLGNSLPMIWRFKPALKVGVCRRVMKSKLLCLYSLILANMWTTIYGVYFLQVHLRRGTQYFCLVRVITMAMVIVVSIHMVVIGCLRVIISLFAEIATVTQTEPLYMECTQDNTFFLRLMAFVHSLSVASRTDGGQREIYQFKRSVALNKNR